MHTMQRSRAKKEAGFTLIELLVVIAIIGLLASVILASLNTARQKGRDARRQADMKEVQTALELYYDNNGNYPPNVTTNTDNPGFQSALAELVSDGDMSSIPTDPGSNTYYYVTTTGGSYYCLGTNLEGPNVPGSSCNTTTSGLNAAPATGDGAYNVGP